MLTFKTVNASSFRGWQVSAGDHVIGTVFDTGLSRAQGAAWEGVAPDGTSFTAMSRAKVAEKLLIHALLPR